MERQDVDEYEHFNYDHDKHMYSGKSGKGRSKVEASKNTNHHDPSGTRKNVQKLMNNASNNSANKTPTHVK